MSLAWWDDAQRATLVVALYASFAACSADDTAIIVVVDTDYRIPEQAESLRIEISGSFGLQHSINQPLGTSSAPDLPMSFAPRPAAEQGSAGVKAVLLLGGSPVAIREARTSFVPGQTRMLYIQLLRGCRAQMCPDGTECDAGGCVAVDLSPDELPPWEGSPPPPIGPGPAASDGGVEDASDSGAGCPPNEIGALCDGLDDDLCEEGTFECLDGASVCNDDTDDHLELCDGEDNDCDPSTPDGRDEDMVGTACDGDDADECLDGVVECRNGALRCTDPDDELVDVCDGVDNDCDAGTADGSQDPRLGMPCDGSDADLCQEGTFTGCEAGQLVCDDNTGNTVEEPTDGACADGRDNDCDGLVDELDPGCACSRGTCNCPAPPSGAPSCPSRCTGGCEEHVCRIRCVGVSACEGDNIICPDGFDCLVECRNDDSCRDVQIACPSTASCAVSCQGEDACNETEARCGAGACSIECLTGSNVCEDAVVRCGSGPCLAQCATAGTIPSLQCGESCSCMRCAGI